MVFHLVILKCGMGFFFFFPEGKESKEGGSGTHILAPKS